MPFSSSESEGEEKETVFSVPFRVKVESLTSLNSMESKELPSFPSRVRFTSPSIPSGDRSRPARMRLSSLRNVFRISRAAS